MVMDQREEAFRLDCVPKSSLVKEAIEGEEGKTCTSFLHRSGAYLTLDSFNGDRTRVDGLNDRCKDCKRYAILLNRSKSIEADSDFMLSVAERVLSSPKITPPKEDVKPVDNRLRRHNWPRDAASRRSGIIGCLGFSLVENEGDIAEVSDCLNVPIHEILDFVDNNSRLMECRDLGRRVKSIRTESKLYKLSANGNQQSVKMVLNNLDPDNWSDRQTVNVNHAGFAPPEEKTAGSVLSLVKGEKDD